MTIEHVQRVTCDECGRKFEMAMEAKLSTPWRYVNIQGYVGTFHACSMACESGIHERKGRTRSKVAHRRSRKRG